MLYRWELLLWMLHCWTCRLRRQRGGSLRLGAMEFGFAYEHKVTLCSPPPSAYRTLVRKL